MKGKVLNEGKIITERVNNFGKTHRWTFCLNCGKA